MELVDLRKSLAINQRDFAVILDISRSVLSMNELGSRSLPNGAIAIKNDIQQRLQHDVLVENKHMRKARRRAAKKLVKKMERELLLESTRLHELQATLMRMGWEHALTRRRLVVIGENEISISNRDHYTQVFGLWYPEILESYAMSHPEEQQWLQEEIEASQARVNRITERIAVLQTLQHSEPEE